MTKTCTKCLEEKPLTEFHNNKRTKDGKAYYCKPCIGDSVKKHHEDNEPYKERQKQSKAEMTRINREYLWEYLNANPCAFCGVADPRVLEFDHIDETTKTKEINYLATRANLEALKAEIAKCRVLCANCHRIRTGYQFNYWWTKLE